MTERRGKSGRALFALPDDGELTERAIAGDGQAILRLLDLVAPDVRTFARQQCRWNDADDATQEALWLLYRRVGMLRVAASLPSWLYTVVRHQCLKLAMQAARSSSRERRWFAEARFAVVPSPELRLDVAAAIESLPVHYRAIVLLRDFEDLTIAEIGARLNLSRETVKGRMHRARSLLREYLAADRSANGTDPE